LPDLADQQNSTANMIDCRRHADAILVFNKEVQGFAELLAHKITPCFESHVNYVRTLSGFLSEGEWRFMLKHPMDRMSRVTSWCST
jgi:hypothetical protein